MQRHRLLILAFGGILGPIGDACHVGSRTLDYPPSPWLLPGMPFPLWVPPLFATAALALAELNVTTELILKSPRRPTPSPASVVAAIMSFVALYAVSGYLPFPTGGLRDFVLALGAIAIWWRFNASRAGLLAGIVAMIVGTLIETFLSASGAFAYLPGNTNLGYVPSWLPWLYLAASVATAHFARFLARQPSPAA